MTFDPERSLHLLVCPKSHAPLVYNDGTLVSTDAATRLRYDIRDGIPVLLIDDATELTVADWAAIMTTHHRDPATGAAIEPINGQPE